MTRAGAIPSIKLLLMLGGVVMLVHLLVLQGSPLRFGAKPDSGPPAARAFSTRAIEPATTVAEAPAAPARPVARPTKPRPTGSTLLYERPISSPFTGMRSSAAFSSLRRF